MPVSGCLRFVAIAAIVLGEVAATPQSEPFVASSYTRPQHLVSVGRRRMNIYCSGNGSPTVVLDAGLGDGTLVWRYVQGPIARYTRVCSYDRAGMGFSDPTTSSRDAGAVVSDLHALLRGAGITPPYVMVGHSIAGLYSRLYADRYPREVVGLVLVDPSTEYEDALYEKIAPERHKKGLSELHDAQRACATDVSKCTLANLALLKTQLKAGGCPKVDPTDCAANEGFYSQQLVRSSYWKDELFESLAFPTSSAEVRAEQRPYRDMPLIVLSAGHPDNSPGGTLSAAQQQTIWMGEVRLQDRVAALSSRGVRFTIQGSGHLIQEEQPSAVISAVDEVVDQARYPK